MSFDGYKYSFLWNVFLGVEVLAIGMVPLVDNATQFSKASVPVYTPTSSIFNL